MTDTKNDTPPDAAVPAIPAWAGGRNWVAVGVIAWTAAALLMSMLTYALRQQVVLAAMQPETRQLVEVVDTRMTATEITTLVASSAALLTVVFTGVVNIIVAFRTERKVEKAVEHVVEVSQKADVIAGHVNSAASASAAKIDAMQNQITQLTASLNESKTTALALAQAQAQTEIVRAGVTVPASPSAVTAPSTLVDAAGAPMTSALSEPGIPIPLPVVVVDEDKK